MFDFAFTGLPDVALAFLSAMFITWLAIPLVVKITKIRKLTDPPGPRKIHRQAIPMLGGIGIFAGFTFGFLMSIDSYMPGMNYFVVATMFLFFVGMKDDLITLDPKKRLFAEFIVAIALVYFTDIRITSFHGLSGITNIPLWLTYLTTIFIMVVIINSVNLIDGIDGLAASIGIIASVTMGTWFWLSGSTGYTIMAASLAGALIMFLWFNISGGENKIFMGDTGALIIGFILAAMTISFNEINSTHSSNYNLYSSPAISIAILIVPLFDTLRVFTIRILKGKSPFAADNRHIHHLMLRAGYSHRRSTFFISLVNIGIIALAFSLDGIGILWLSLVLLLVCILLTGVLFILVYRNYFFNNITVQEKDYGMMYFISRIHGHIIKKKIQIPFAVRSSSHDAAIHVTDHHSKISDPFKKHTTAGHKGRGKSGA